LGGRVIGQGGEVLTGSAVGGLWATDQSELLSVVFSITDDLSLVIDVIGGTYYETVETVTAPPGLFDSSFRGVPSLSGHTCSQLIFSSST